MVPRKIMNKLCLLLEPLIPIPGIEKDRLFAGSTAEAGHTLMPAYCNESVLSSTSVLRANALCNISYLTFCWGVLVEVTASMSISRLLVPRRYKNLGHVGASGSEKQYRFLRRAGLGAPQVPIILSQSTWVPSTKLTHISNFGQPPFLGYKLI